MKTVTEGLKAAGIEIGDLANDPLKAIECVGDPMMPANVGMIIGAAKHVPVIIGGGTQMAAVIAAAVKLDPSIVGNIFQGTTRWLMEDPNSNMAKMMDSISDDVPIVYVNMDYSSSPFEGLQAYEWGYIKEGVGCGGASVASIIQSSGEVTCMDLLDKVHDIYKKIMNFD
jgi:NaMN:DMB phosphoribosyltransferase